MGRLALREARGSEEGSASGTGTGDVAAAASGEGAPKEGEKSKAGKKHENVPQLPRPARLPPPGTTSDARTPLSSPVLKEVSKPAAGSSRAMSATLENVRRLRAEEVRRALGQEGVSTHDSEAVVLTEKTKLEKGKGKGKGKVGSAAAGAIVGDARIVVEKGKVGVEESVEDIAPATVDMDFGDFEDIPIGQASERTSGEEAGGLKAESGQGTEGEESKKEKLAGGKDLAADDEEEYGFEDETPGSEGIEDADDFEVIEKPVGGERNGAERKWYKVWGR